MRAASCREAIRRWDSCRNGRARARGTTASPAIPSPWRLEARTFKRADNRAEARRRSRAGLLDEVLAVVEKRPKGLVPPFNACHQLLDAGRRRGARSKPVACAKRRGECLFRSRAGLTRRTRLRRPKSSRTFSAHLERGARLAHAARARQRDQPLRSPSSAAISATSVSRPTKEVT